MSQQHDSATRCFTVDQANAMLPLVRAITEDMVRLGRDLFDREQRLEYLKAAHRGGGNDPYVEELLQIEEELERQKEKLAGYVRELQELGVEPKSATEGLIDFPAVIEGRLVYLCWKLGESELRFWHELDAGFAGRQPLPAVSVGRASNPDSRDDG